MLNPINTRNWRNFKRKAGTPFEKELVSYLDQAFIELEAMERLLLGENNNVANSKNAGSGADQ